jgi:hypothetical protein
MHSHQILWDLDVIIIGDFYPLICDVGIFKINMNTIDSFALRFWMEKTKCYGLKQIICQNKEQFINYLNEF